MTRRSIAGTALLTAAALLALPVVAKADSKTPDGKAVYTKNCSSCHAATGQGVPGTFPPLAKNSFVTGDQKKVATVLVKGLNGEIKVNGKSYNGTMPAWKGTLSNAEIAAVANYIRTAWGNKASKKVAESDVAAVK
jgi:mono/diheme cytochrome c family protein